MANLWNGICNLEKLGKRVKIQDDIPETKELVRRTAKVALPSILESFLIAIVGIVDTYMVSGLGDYAISAVGLTTQPKFLALALFFAISIAVSSLVARRRGEGRHEEASKILQQALLVTLALTVVITALALLVGDPAMRLVGSQEDTHQPALAYYNVIMLGMVFNVVTIVINAAQRGAGNTQIALKTNIVANLVNVVFNYLLIGGNLGFPRLEVQGAAIATVIGTVVACAMALRSVTRPTGYLQLLRGFRLKLDRVILKSLVKLGAPTLAEQVIIRVGFLIYFGLVARLGTTANAAHNIGMNFLHISFAFADGLSVAAVALVGRSLGEKRRDLALIYSSICQRFGLACSFLVAIVYAPFGHGLYSMFSTTEAVMDYGRYIMPIIAVVSFIQITMLIFISCLRAAGDVKYVAVMSLVCIGIIRPLSSWILCYPLGLGLIGAWLGMVIDQSIRLFLSYTRYRKGKWMDIQI